MITYLECVLRCNREKGGTAYIPYSRLLVRHCKTMCAVNLLSCIVIGAYLFVGNGHVYRISTLCGFVDDFIHSYVYRCKEVEWHGESE